MVSTRLSSSQGEGSSTSSGWELMQFRGGVQDVASTNQRVFLIDLPQEVLEKIFKYLKFKNIGQLRLVSHDFNELCSRILNKQFSKLQTEMLTRFHSIKARMPRRESARRIHPLACESDIIETLHMRLALLQMTLGKHIERNYCCFFAGEILDEIERILLYISSTPKLTRPYKVTDELFDLTSMAMEYFKEKIEPTLPEICYLTDFMKLDDTQICGSTNKYMSMDSPSGNESPVDPPTPSQRVSALPPPMLNSINRTALFMKKRISRVKDTVDGLNTQLCKTKREVKWLRKQNASQQTQITECKARIDKYEKKHEDMSQKFGTLLQELNKCKMEFQYWRSKSPATPLLCGNCGSQMKQSTEDLRTLLGSDFVPIVGPSGMNDFGFISELSEDMGNNTADEITYEPQAGPSGMQQQPKQEQIEHGPSSTKRHGYKSSSRRNDNEDEPPRSKRKRDKESKDVRESRKSLRGKSKKKSK